MDDYYASIQSRRKASTWIAILIQKIWTIYHFPQWTNRNKYVHNLDRVSVSSRERLNLLASLEGKYKSEDPLNLLAKDRHLLEQSLQTLKKLPNALIRAWLLEFQTATSTRDKIFNVETAKSSAVLRSFLSQISNTSQTPPQIQTRTIHTISIPQQMLPVPHFDRQTHAPRSTPPRQSSKTTRSRKRKATSIINNPRIRSSPQRTQHCLRTPHIPPHHTFINPITSSLRPTNTTKTSPTNPAPNIGRYITNIEYAYEPTPIVPTRPFTWNTRGTKTDLMRGSWRPP